jgi:hypothetical protein
MPTSTSTVVKLNPSELLTGRPCEDQLNRDPA